MYKGSKYEGEPQVEFPETEKQKELKGLREKLKGSLRMLEMDIPIPAGSGDIVVEGKSGYADHTTVMPKKLGEFKRRLQEVQNLVAKIEEVGARPGEPLDQERAKEYETL